MSNVSPLPGLFNKYLGDGARSSKWDVVFTFPTGMNTDNRSIPMSIKAASFPSAVNHKIDLKFKGRTIPVKGQSGFRNSWNCTFYLSENHNLKLMFESWIRALDNIKYDTQSSAFSLNKYYTATANVYQVNFQENSRTVEYVLYNVFPYEINDIGIDYEGPGRILTLEVTFAFSHMLNTGKTYTGTTADLPVIRPLNVYSGSTSSKLNMFSEDATLSAQLNQNGANSATVSHSSTGITTVTTNTPRYSQSSTYSGSFAGGFKEAVRQGLGAFADPKAWVQSKINDLTSSTFTTAEQLILGHVVDSLRSLTSPIENAANSFINSIKNGASTIMSGALTGLKNTAASALEATGIKGGASKVMGGITDGLNAASGKINEVSASVGKTLAEGYKFGGSGSSSGSSSGGSSNSGSSKGSSSTK